MENNFGFDYYQYHHMLSRDPNLPGYPFHNGYPNIDPVHRNPWTDEVFTLKKLPSFPVSELQQMKANVTDKPQKQFLVFDHSGDKTTMLFSSVAYTPIQFGAYRAPIPPTACNLKEETDTNDPFAPHLNGENVEDYSRDVSKDEMHENTEELDALLCSDEDSDFSEDDETSTGHSPSTMTDNGVPNLDEEAGEEVDSFSIPSKRRKLSSGEAWLKTGSCSALETQADSWSRKEKIYETVNILQRMVPNVNGRDSPPIVVIEEAIDYLKRLKAEVKALGVDAI